MATYDPNDPNVIARQQGYKPYNPDGTGPTAAFTKLASEAMAKNINTKNGTNYTGLQMDSQIRAGNPNIPTLSGVNPQKPQQTTPPVDPMADWTKQAQAMKQAQINASVANLSNKYNQVKQGLTSKQAQLDPTYDAKRLGEQSSSQLQAKNFAEFLASRGQARSGTANQAEMMRNLQLQQTFNGLNKQQADENQYYNQQLDAAQSAYNNDVTAAQNQAEADYMNNFLRKQSEMDQYRQAQELQRMSAEESRKIAAMNAFNTSIENDKNRQATAEQNAITNGLKADEAARKEEADRAKYIQDGSKNFADITGYNNPYYGTQIPQEVMDKLAPYSDNYEQYAQGMQGIDPQMAQWAHIASVQKMMSDPALRAQYGQNYLTRKAQVDDRNYNLDLGKFDYGVEKDQRDYDYGVQRDRVKDTQWGNDYGLRKWTAEDSSANRWANTGISQQNANTSASRARSSNSSNVNQIATDVYNTAKQQFYDKDNNSWDTNRMLGYLDMQGWLNDSNAVDAIQRKIGFTDSQLKRYMESRNENMLKGLPGLGG